MRASTNTSQAMPEEERVRALSELSLRMKDYLPVCLAGLLGAGAGWLAARVIGQEHIVT